MRSRRFRFLFCLLAIAMGLAARAHADWQWTRQTISGVGTIRALAYGNGIFVAGTTTGYLLNSRDGVNWGVTRPATRAINDVAFGGNRFVAIVDGTAGIGVRLLYSLDGAIWTAARRVASGGSFRGKYDLADIASLSGRFVALGGSSRSFATSVNGTRWQYPLGGAKPRNYIASTTGLTASGNRYLLCSTFAAATIQSSPDGAAWTTEFMSSARGPARAIEAERPGRRAICVGENGLCLTSSNGGDSWRSQPFGSVDFLDLTSGADLFAACTEKFVYTTPAGLTWTRQLRVTRNADRLRVIVRGAGLTIAAGTGGNGRGLIFTSNGTPAP